MLVSIFNVFLGYSTHIVGKWHLGYFEWEYTPTYRGFDTFYGMYNGAEDHWSHEREGILDFRNGTTPVTDQDGIYSTHVFAKVSILASNLNLIDRTLKLNLLADHSQGTDNTLNEP